MKKELLGTQKKFKGEFYIYRTDNPFDFIEEDEQKAVYDDITGEKLFKYGHIRPKATLDDIGTIVGDNQFVVANKYPSTVFFINPPTRGE